jgi:uncharacterized membrane protein
MSSDAASAALPDSEGSKPSSNLKLKEARWPASLAVVATLLLYVTLPQKLIYGPPWLVPALVLALLVPLSITVPNRHAEELRWQRYASIALIALVNAANIISLISLVEALLEGEKTNGGQLILSAIQIWVTNVLIFALWYWEFDRGGPGARLSENPGYPDFLFPQLTTPSVAPRGWRPIFIDYLFVSFTNASAFSPTDTLPLTPWAKMMMLVQALASLLTVALVAARAVNILNSGL